MPKIADVLEKAAEVIETQGHLKGDYWDGALEGYKYESGPVCLAGAVMVAQGVYYAENEDVAHAPLGKVLSYLTETCNARHIPSWNDVDERTQDEVIDTLKTIAKDIRNAEVPQ